VVWGKSVKWEEEKKALKICMWRDVGAWGCMRLLRRSGRAEKSRKTRAMLRSCP